MYLYLCNKALSSYGFVIDGEWHQIEIPLADLAAAGLDLRQVEAPLVFIAGAGDVGDRLFVDDVYLNRLNP